MLFELGQCEVGFIAAFAPVNFILVMELENVVAQRRLRGEQLCAVLIVALVKVLARVLLLVHIERVLPLE